MFEVEILYARKYKFSAFQILSNGIFHRQLVNILIHLLDESLQIDFCFFVWWSVIDFFHFYLSKIHILHFRILFARKLSSRLCVWDLAFIFWILLWILLIFQFILFTTLDINERVFDKMLLFIFKVYIHWKCIYLKNFLINNSKTIKSTS